MEVKFREIHKLLPRLPDKVFFQVVSEGLQIILANAKSFLRDAELLGKHDRINSQSVLFNIAEEEAGKFLLLLDAVRCPRRNLPKHLKRFYSHIAKGIYAISSYWQPGDFSEVQQAIDKYFRQSALILVEPEGAWIAKNPVTTQRELLYYVDYIVSYTGKQFWANPSDNRTPPPVDIPEALELAEALYNAGFTNPSSLAIIADIWRPIQMRGDFSFRDLYRLNLRTLRRLSKEGLLRTQAEETFRLILDRWSFPMHSVELGRVGTKPDQLKDKLREINEALWGTE